MFNVRIVLYLWYEIIMAVLELYINVEKVEPGRGRLDWVRSQDLLVGSDKRPKPTTTFSICTSTEIMYIW